MQLKWKHAYQFAGYYMAKEKGYYRDAGLDVELREGGPNVNFVDEVISGRAHYATGATGILLDRYNGKPVVVLGVIFQHSPDVLFVSQASGITHPRHLVGKTIMDSASTPTIAPMLLAETGSLQKFNLLPQDNNYQGLIDGQFDATAGYSTNETFFYREQQFPVTLLKPITYGIDFYGDNLFTSEDELSRHLQRVDAFRQASFKGWEYAMAHPVETINIIRKYGSTRSPEHLRFEYEAMRELVLPAFTEMGYMNPGRWQRIADTYVKLGQLQPDYSLEGFLYHPGMDIEKLKHYLGITLVVTLMAAGVILALGFFNRRLAQQKLTLQESEARFQHVADTAPVKIWMSDHTRQCIYFNKPWLEFTGRTLAQELGNGWSEGVHPEDYEQCLNTYTAAFDARRHFNMEYRLRRHDGEYRWAYIQGVPRHTPDGVFIGYIGSCIDITERKQAELMVSLENQLLGMIASGVPTSTTLDMLLRFLEGLSPDMLCSILLLDADGVHLHHCSAPSLPEVYCRAIDGVAIGANVGSCGTAAFRREAVFVDDITSNPLWTDFKELALSHGLRACWSTPIFDAQSQVLGTFAIYHRQPCHPNALQQQLIKTATHIASIAISMKNIEAEKSKNAQRALHYKEILLQLSQQQFVNLPDHLRAITEAGAQALNVERIGIWTLHGNSLECCDLYLASVGEHQHIAPYILPDSSRYFIALQQREVIRAEDVRTDPRTTEFNKFFESKDISSVMDVPIWAHGHMVGVLGCDHTGTRRQWTDFEEDFARHLTAIVSVAMEEEERRQVEKTLRKSDKQYQENLEQRVAERTSELSTVNLELERARNVAESASEAKSLFLSRMSHELRTPLHAILGFSQLLKDGLSNATQDEINFLQQIQHSSQHLMDMINEVLDLARIEAGKLDLILEDIDLNDGICTECLALVQTIAEKNNIALHLKAGGNHPIVVYADRIRLKQVLLNLLSNAVKYNRPQGSVIMEYNTDAKVVRVTVTDTGKGIPENQHDRLFQPFTRIHRNYGNIEGTGIGLTITQRLIEGMGGKIGFTSAVGVGSTFWMELRAGRTKSRGKPEVMVNIEAGKAPASTVKPGSNAKVLYIEDTMANVQLMRFIVKRLSGVELLDTDTAESGIVLAVKSHPDLILMDINLPGMDGIEALQILRQKEVTRDIPVIAISAAAMAHDLERIQQAGFDDILSKPFNIHTVPAILSKHLYRA